MDELTDEEKEQLREMLDTWESAKIGIKAMSILGNAIKWIAGIIIAVAAAIAVFHGNGGTHG